MSSSSSVRHPSPKPHRTLHRQSSDPLNLSSGPKPKPSQIYVLSADGSSLFLLDPTKPSGNEEPPPYAPYTADVHLTQSSISSAASEAGPSSPRGVLSPVSLPSIISSGPTETRGRAFTLQDGNSSRSTRPVIRNNNSFSHSFSNAHSHAHRYRQDGTRSASSSPVVRTSELMDERTPLLHRSLDDEEWTEIDWYKRRSLMRAIFCGELEEGDEGMRWKDGWRRFWRPVGQGRYWKAMVHLWFLNFPFALFLWPPLVAGTLAGTALLITLPIGAAVWWLTLFIARSAARLENIMQLNYHSPLRPSIPQPKYHPIFYRIKERPSHSAGHSGPVTPVSESPPDLDVVWEKRFIKCSYAMFCDHYSYSALSYFLLIKPLIVLFSTILLWALFPVALVLLFALPIYLRAGRRWGQWQAGVAIENL